MGRYIEDFERIKELAGRYDEYPVSRCTRLTVPTIREYLGIVRTYHPELFGENKDNKGDEYLNNKN